MSIPCHLGSKPASDLFLVLICQALYILKVSSHLNGCNFYWSQNGHLPLSIAYKSQSAQRPAKNYDQKMNILLSFMWFEFLHIFYKKPFYLPAEVLMGTGKQPALFPWVIADQYTCQFWQIQQWFFFSPLLKYGVQLQVELLLFKVNSPSSYQSEWNDPLIHSTIPGYT